MADNKSNKDYDFKAQLEDAQKEEDYFKKILLSKGTKFELKTESNLWHDKGNIVIEYESHKKTFRNRGNQSRLLGTSIAFTGQRNIGIFDVSRSYPQENMQ